MRSDVSRWLLVALGFVSLALAFSTRSFLGLTMPEWELEFGWTRSSISGGGAVALVVMAGIAPLVGYAIDRYGARLVLSIGMAVVGIGSLMLSAMQGQAMFFLAFGGVSALGFGIVSMHAVATAIAPVFEKNRGLATGIASGGATAGQLLFVPLFSLVLSLWGWRAGYAIMAIVTLAIAAMFPMVLCQAKGSRVDRARSEAKSESLRSRLRMLATSPVFHALFWSFSICGFSTAGIIETHLLPYAAICGYGPVASASAYGVLSAFNLLGMVAAGYLSDRINNVLLLFGIYLLRAVSFVMLLYIDVDVTLLFAFAAAFGLFDYSTVPVTASLVANRLGVKTMGLAMGLLATGHALGAAAGAYLGGVVFDSFASYGYVWVSSVVLAVISAFIVTIIPGRPVDAGRLQGVV